VQVADPSFDPFLDVRREPDAGKRDARSGAAPRWGPSRRLSGGFRVQDCAQGSVVGVMVGVMAVVNFLVNRGRAGPTKS
jgi:hypothetical protein